MSQSQQKYLAEVFGTFTLVFVGATAVVGFGVIYAPFAFGLGLLAALYAFGKISAVTSTRRSRWDCSSTAAFPFPT